MSLLAKLVDRMEEGRPEAGHCGEYRSQVDNVRAGLGDSARQGTFEWLDSMLVKAFREGKCSPDLHLGLLLLTKVLGRPEAEVLVRSLQQRLGL